MKAFHRWRRLLGRQVVQRLLADGHHVVCMLRARSNADNLRADAAKPGVRGTLEIIRGHIGRPDTIRTPWRAAMSFTTSPRK